MKFINFKVLREKEDQLKELIEAQKLEVNKQKNDQIVVANKKKEIIEAEKGNDIF